MGKARRLEAGTRKVGSAIEYVRTRNVLRFVSWVHDELIDPVEIPADELCERLGIDPRVFGVPQHFLLFAGLHRHPAGGLRDLVGTYQTSEEAWGAFRQLREAHPSVSGWAQLAAIDGAGRLQQLAWYGLAPSGEPDGDPSPSPRVVGDGTRALRRIIPMPDRPVPQPYLRAVTPS